MAFAYTENISENKEIIDNTLVRKNICIPGMPILCQLVHTHNPNTCTFVLLYTYFFHCVVYLSKVCYILLMFVEPFFCMETRNIAYVMFGFFCLVVVVGGFVLLLLLLLLFFVCFGLVWGFFLCWFFVVFRFLRLPVWLPNKYLELNILVTQLF